MKTRVFPLLALVFLTRYAVASVEMMPRQLPPLSCATGEPDSFAINGLAQLPPTTELTLPPFDLPSLRKVKAPDANTNLRIDACLIENGDGPELILQRVLLLGLSGRAQVVSIPDDKRDLGLSAALFQGAYSGLDITIPFHEYKIDQHAYPDSRILVVKGGEGFAYATILRDGKTVSDVVVGELTEGDPLLGKVCGPQYRQEERTLTLGTARVALTICDGMAGTSGTYAYTIAKAVITDSSRELPSAARNQPFTVESGTALKYKVNHHNTCDSFALQSPYALYTMTAFSGTPPDADRCDQPRVVDGAPTGTMAEHHGQPAYRIHYNDSGKTAEGHLAGCRRLTECQ